MPFDRGSTQWTLWQERKALLRRTAQLREVVQERDAQRAAQPGPRPWWLRLVGLVRTGAVWKVLPFTGMDGDGEDRAPSSREGRSTRRRPRA